MFALLQFGRGYGVLYLPADEIEFQFKRRLVGRVSAPSHEELAYRGAYRRRQRAYLVKRDGDIAPAQQDLPLLFNETAHDVLYRLAIRLVMRQECHPNRVVAGFARRYPQPAELFGEEFVRHLYQHARAVAGFGIRAFRAAMLKAAKRLNAALQDHMGALALYVGDKPHAAGVMLKARVVQTLLGQVGDVSLCHLGVSLLRLFGAAIGGRPAAWRLRAIRARASSARFRNRLSARDSFPIPVSCC